MNDLDVYDLTDDSSSVNGCWAGYAAGCLTGRTIRTHRGLMHCYASGGISVGVADILLVDERGDLWRSGGPGRLSSSNDGPAVSRCCTYTCYRISPVAVKVESNYYDLRPCVATLRPRPEV